ncbi:hypothetical protein, partial [Terasakiella sp.]|uniref:hypothetical protein n=1 Tax=Terasakiella sp. TaxID=2034861 RepID=UPI003AA903D7
KIKLIPFTADYISGDLQLKEHADAVLVEKQHLLDLDWAAADVPVVEELMGMFNTKRVIIN